MNTNLLRVIPVSFAAVLLLFSCTGANKLVKQTHAFFVTLYPGIVAVDEQGKELPSNIQTKYSVYAVTGSDNVKWESAWINNRIYTINAQKIRSSPVFEVGVDKQTGTKVTIQVGETEHLYLLQFTPGSNTSKTDFESFQKLMMKAIYKGKKINCTITNIKELTTPDPV